MKIFRRLFFFITIILLIIISILLITGYVHYSEKLQEQPLTDRINELIAIENYVTYDELPEDYINALLATEDNRFYEHGAIDPIGIARAMLTNLQNKEFSEGGSTITQQFAKNLIFTQDKDIIRKISEVYAAYDIEKFYSKNDIIAFYANISYFGDGNYGIYEASQAYFEKDPIDLNLDEASMLAGIPNAPSLYAPTVNLELAKARQEHVLERMIECGYITEEEKASLNKEEEQLD